MLRFDTPIIVVTRPKQDARRFVDALREGAGLFDAVISPAFEYGSIVFGVPDFDVGVFTSAVGVAYAPLGRGRTAYCVGANTAKAAKATGYVAMSADGSADDLVELILRDNPRGTFLHVRGENSVGNVRKRLAASGFTCLERIAYRKVALRPTPELDQALSSGRIIIIPIFSAETVSIISNWPVHWKGCTLVCMSEPIAKAAASLEPQNTVVVQRPDMVEMLREVRRLIA